MNVLLSQKNRPQSLFFQRLIFPAKGEQREAGFLKLNSSGRIPVLIDDDTQTLEPIVLTQSIAILQYLAEKTGEMIPKSLEARAKVYEWMHFHAVDIGSTLFSAFYLQ